MRLFERAARRAGLPLRMREGFNPRPRISFPLSLALGVEGREEVAGVQLTDWLAPEEVRRRLARALPRGLDVIGVSTVDPRHGGRVVAVTYLIEHPAIAGLSAADLDALLAREEVPVTRLRKGRQVVVDIRPYLHGLTLAPAETDRPMTTSRRSRPALRVDLRVTPKGTARADEVFALLVQGSAVRGQGSGTDQRPPEPGALAPGPGTVATRIVRERVVLAGSAGSSSWAGQMADR